MGTCRSFAPPGSSIATEQSRSGMIKQYKKAHVGTALKANAFGGTSHAKGIVLEKAGVETKQPDSAIRQCARVQLIKNGKKEKKKSQLLYSMMVAYILLRKMMKFWLLAVVTKGTLLATFLESTLRLSK